MESCISLKFNWNQFFGRAWSRDVNATKWVSSFIWMVITVLRTGSVIKISISISSISSISMKKIWLWHCTWPRKHRKFVLIWIVYHPPFHFKEVRGIQRIYRVDCEDCRCSQRCNKWNNVNTLTMNVSWLWFPPCRRRRRLHNKQQQQRPSPPPSLSKGGSSHPVVVSLPSREMLHRAMALVECRTFGADGKLLAFDDDDDGNSNNSCHDSPGGFVQSLYEEVARNRICPTTL